MEILPRLHLFKMAAPMKIFRELSRKGFDPRHVNHGPITRSMFCQPCGKQTVHYARASSVAASTEPSAQTREPVPQPPPVRSIFRTPVSNPVNHGLEQEAQFYTIPPDEYKTMFPQDHGMPSRFKKQVDTFTEACIMVRKPSLEVMSYLQQANYSHPAIRYVFYGIRGTGKTLCLCHVLHYCTKQGWVVLFFPKVSNWVKNVKEIQPSFHNPERYDQPLEAVAWLKTFKVSAADSIKELQTQQKYQWNKREATEQGRPLLEVVEQGIARPKTATDCVGVIVKELKDQANQGRIRLLVAVDGVNSLFGRTVVRKPDRSMAYASELSLTYNLRKLVRNDWRGGAIVTAVKEAGFLGMEGEKKDHRRYTRHEDHPDIYHDILDHVSARPQTFTPEALLGKEGFEYMDPYVPVLVEKYTEKEIESCLDYYTDRMWIQNEKCWTEAGRQQLKFLSGYEPADLERICGPL
ncbi:28S ribosomal protein S29, mitochondrial-like [Branchiostoma floridae]|uniref:Small ribosomal subunit protein mS29 n=1 Tax=Branchiostoma floridae TaxID=7739 RepID=A0A9J7HY80_BRAFL|nr:28S ribosomal protein S29, mitochondrial-like [Branchiostoma floridae]